MGSFARPRIRGNRGLLQEHDQRNEGPGRCHFRKVVQSPGQVEVGRINHGRTKGICGPADHGRNQAFKPLFPILRDHVFTFQNTNLLAHTNRKDKAGQTYHDHYNPKSGTRFAHGNTFTA